MLQILFLFNVFVKHTSKKKNDKIVEGIFKTHHNFRERNSAEKLRL